MTQALGYKLLTPEFYNLVYRDIVEFRTIFDLPIHVGSLSQASNDLHTALFVEEFIELSAATKRVDQIDAITDLLYVHVGRLVEMGADTIEKAGIHAYIIEVLLMACEKLNINLVKAWHIVHSSNMSKVCRNEKTAIETIEFYKNQDIEATYTLKYGRYVIKAAKEHILKDKTIKKGKVLKSIKMKQPDLTAL